MEADTRSAMVRVLILVEDSPLYRSFFLPLIYKVVVRQTLSVLEDSLNEEHRLLKMRARPKILVAENYEEAMALFDRFEPYVFGVMSDTRFSMDCRITPDAGFMLLRKIKERVPYLPLLLLSAEPRPGQGQKRFRRSSSTKTPPTSMRRSRIFSGPILGSAT